MTSKDKKYVWTATVEEKGQVVIPKQARDVFGVKSGGTLLILGNEQKGLAIPPKGVFTELFDMIHDEDGDGK